MYGGGQHVLHFEVEFVVVHILGMGLLIFVLVALLLCNLDQKLDIALVRQFLFRAWLGRDLSLRGQEALPYFMMRNIECLRPGSEGELAIGRHQGRRHVGGLKELPIVMAEQVNALLERGGRREALYVVDASLL